VYETWHLLTAYFVGTAGGIWIFRQTVKEELVSRALDTLVEEDYVRSFIDDDGITQLYKWYELEDIIEDLYRKKKTHDLIQETIDSQNKLWGEDDDSA